MSDTKSKPIQLEIDGKAIEGKHGQMLIELTDAENIPVPRFCYHKKLSVAANCRMCLVEVENAPKPLPACATPIVEGMKVHTRSPLAREAQQGTLEFLLINHPLDCPVCDQGGECPLQEMSIGYGQSHSVFQENKRAVKEKDIGPLIATEMTRCIHCTLCVRFGEEIAGVREMGAIGRGENMAIGTYIQSSIDSELSGNAIDLCPVGALTSKPFRFTARPWELSSVDSTAPHDALGSSIRVQTLRDEVMRVLPRENNAVNEIWLADRDRYSYQAVNHESRLTQPMIKRDGCWEVCDWEEAMHALASGLKKAGAQAGALLGAGTTAEEAFLLANVWRQQGSTQMDYRLRTAGGEAPDTPLQLTLGCPIAEVPEQPSIMVIGGNVTKDQPILGLKLRQATQRGGQVHLLHPMTLSCRFEPASQWCGGFSSMEKHLKNVLKALRSLKKGNEPTTDKAALALAHALHAQDSGVIWLGVQAQQATNAAGLQTVAQALAELAGHHLGWIPEGAHVNGARQAGIMGAGVAAMLEADLSAWLLLNVHPDLDMAAGQQAIARLQQADFVAAASAFVDEGLKSCADLLLPVAAFTENEGHYITADGQWSAIKAAVPLPEESKPLWKILRVLGNQLGMADCSYACVEEVTVVARANQPDRSAIVTVTESTAEAGALERFADVATYAEDVLVRHAQALQQTADAAVAPLSVHPSLAKKLSVTDGDELEVSVDETKLRLPVTLDERLAKDIVRIPQGLTVTAALSAGARFVTLTATA